MMIGSMLSPFQTGRSECGICSWTNVTGQAVEAPVDFGATR